MKLRKTTLIKSLAIFLLLVTTCYQSAYAYIEYFFYEIDQKEYLGLRIIYNAYQKNDTDIADATSILHENDPPIHRLEILNSNLTAELLQPILTASQTHNTLQSLAIRGSLTTTDESLLMLSNFLHTYNMLTSFEFSANTNKINKINIINILSIISALSSNSTLRHLNLGYNFGNLYSNTLTDEDASAMANILRNYTNQNFSIVLSGNQISHNSAKIIYAALKTTPREFLSLNYDSIYRLLRSPQIIPNQNAINNETSATSPSLSLPPLIQSTITASPNPNVLSQTE